MASNKNIKEVNKIITKLIDKNISIKEFRDKIESIFIKHQLLKLILKLERKLNIIKHQHLNYME